MFRKVPEGISGRSISPTYFSYQLSTTETSTSTGTSFKYIFPASIMGFRKIRDAVGVFAIDIANRGLQ